MILQGFYRKFSVVRVRKEQLEKLKHYSSAPKTIEKYLTDYEEFKTQYKSIVEVIEENDVKIPFANFVNLCSRVAVN